MMSKHPLFSFQPVIQIVTMLAAAPAVELIREFSDLLL
jgi:hypothetical protein